MSLLRNLGVWFRLRIAEHRAADPERGASVIETVIIAASLAALALATMAAIQLLVNNKLSSISL